MIKYFLSTPRIFLSTSYYQYCISIDFLEILVLILSTFEDNTLYSAFFCPFFRTKFFYKISKSSKIKRNFFSLSVSCLSTSGFKLLKLIGQFWSSATSNLFTSDFKLTESFFVFLQILSYQHLLFFLNEILIYS